MTDGNKQTLPGASRRPLLKVVAGSVGLLAAGVGARLTLYQGEEGEPLSQDALVLSTDGTSDVRSLYLKLGDDLLPRAAPKHWESRRLPTSTHSMAAFTWGAEQSAPTVSIRSRRGGTWGAWVSVPLLHDRPDSASGEGGEVAGTDLVWIGPADGVQIRVVGRRPRDLTLVLLYPRRRPDDRLLGQVSDGALRRRSGEGETRQAPRPELVSRKEWGADEALREGSPRYNHTIKQVHVHHTVNSNSYARDDVPALIRGMYAYHTQSLGWSDIGYNFLVDRFGRGWVGRAGGPAKLVRGAHTLGFNAESTGVSAIGNYDTVRPSESMLDAIAAISAWKLDPFDRQPRGGIKVESEGSDKYAAGRRVRLPVIDGHRDTNDTACPGQHLYEALPSIRRRAARIIKAAQQATIVIDEPATVTGVPQLGSTLALDPGVYRPSDATPGYRWFRGEEPILGAEQSSYQVQPEDVGNAINCQLTIARSGLEPVIQRESGGQATAPPDVSVTSFSRRRVAHVRVKISAPKGVVLPPTGPVTVQVGKHTKTRMLQNGAVVVRFGRKHGLPVGTYPVRVAYDGDIAFLATSRSTAIEVD